MSCSSCNNCSENNTPCTCGGVNPCPGQTPCGCNDTMLTSPCNYTDCGVGNERCDDVQCAECVSYCGTSFQVAGPNGLLAINSGERLDAILQKFALVIAKGLGACTSVNLHHAPYNLYAANITNSTVDIVWGGTSSLSVGLNVYYAINTPTAVWIQANTTSISQLLNNYTISNLAPSTSYKIKVESINVTSNVCDSVEIIVTTIA